MLKAISIAKEDKAMSKPLMRDLVAATKDLHSVAPWPGLLRFLILGASFLALVRLAWMAETTLGFVSWTILAGILYTFWLICTHDATHHTLTGWTWFDEISARLISWPMLWPFGIYSELHRLHHSWNGRDLRDPERVQWTEAEYRQATPPLRWYVQHQWPVDIFLLGGFGMIAKTFWHGFILRNSAPRLGWQIPLDGVGMLLVQGSLITLTLATRHGLGQYLLFWVVLERTIGIGIQTRDHLEHYGLWQSRENHLLTQLYACRNLKVLPGTGWLVGGLQLHAVHHAFPGIPCYRLPEAFQRMQVVLSQHRKPTMMVDEGYLQTSLRLGQHPSLINPVGSPDPALRR
jgi:fatty acid desaturase